MTRYIWQIQYDVKDNDGIWLGEFGSVEVLGTADAQAAIDRARKHAFAKERITEFNDDGDETGKTHPIKGFRLTGVKLKTSFDSI